jgi:hypothetical protein
VGRCLATLGMTGWGVGRSHLLFWKQPQPPERSCHAVPSKEEPMSPRSAGLTFLDAIDAGRPPLTPRSDLRVVVR